MLLDPELHHLAVSVTLHAFNFPLVASFAQFVPFVALCATQSVPFIAFESPSVPFSVS